jgi:AcrR family transcriptional regulator
MPKVGEKRKEICRIATALFVEKGFEKTTIRDIAGAGNMNSSALYYYFEDKESILYEILMDIMNTSLDLMREIEKADLSTREKIDAVIELHTRIYGVDPIRMGLIVFNQKSLNPQHWEELKGKQREYTGIVARILGEMREKGEIADLDPTVCTFALFGMIQWAFGWYNPEGSIKPDQLCHVFARIFTRGIYSKAETGLQVELPKGKRK